MRGARGRRVPLFALGSVAALLLAACGGDGDGDGTAGGETDGGDGEAALVGLITKTETNPFFVKMKEGAQAKAGELGAELQSFAGEFDGDNEAQVQAIESLISAGADGILITPSDSAAIVSSTDQARAAGITVIALDTQLEPPDAADATFATDNFLAGELIGQWAAATMGDAAADAKIAMLDLNANEVSVDVQRDQGFLQGFGIDVGDENDIGDENDPRIVGHDVTDGGPEGGRTAMENLLSANRDINVVYTINEPAAAGAWEALEAAGKSPEDVILVSVDGGCPGVEDVQGGVIDATSMQFPLKMAELGVEAIVTGEIPEPEEGEEFYNTGVTLITDAPVDGVESEDSAWGLDNCWG
ncbi:MAG: substrate-binding domain-containing protein [Jiangellaceae bacterium]|nr:substrate-binding domain-containing protein [Jiangellaceae bacterium]